MTAVADHLFRGSKVLSDVPKRLADGRVLAVLLVDNSMEFTGALKLFSGDERVGRVPAIAIVKKGRSRDLLVIHCGEEWNIVGIQVWNAPGGQRVTSVEQAKEIVERYYTNSAGKWVIVES
jgi:hypothetical protein